MSSSSRPSHTNYDEARVPHYELPDPLRSFEGNAVSSAQQWFGMRRPELLAAFETQVYGRAPERCAVKVVSRETDPRALAGTATRSELDVQLCAEHERVLSFRVALWVPNALAEAAPVFVGLNFFGNHSLHPDPALSLARGWLPNHTEHGIVDHEATDASRGCQRQSWPLEVIIARGYAVASTYAGDFDPDHDDGFLNGVHGLFHEPTMARRDDDWAAISAWSWGLRHVLDVLESEPSVDASRAAVIGHSRLGKAALWAAALDRRFALAISNASGHGGAALSRRRFGELTSDMNRRFPHWFCRAFRQYDDREAELLVDQHQLLALIAPRPLYVASASLDHWADPKGEYLACRHAHEVFRLLGSEGFVDQPWPPALDQSLGQGIGYHLRTGSHDLTVRDWQHYLAFVDRHLRSR